MVIVSHCKLSDLSAIKNLLSLYGKKIEITPAHLNKRDISLQARLPSGELVGFVWCGLMANKTLAYVDKAVIHPDHHHQGILNTLYKALFKRAYELGIKEVFAIIRQDEYHDASAVNTLKMAVGADSLNYTYVVAKLDKMKKDLGLEI